MRKLAAALTGLALAAGPVLAVPARSAGPTPPPAYLGAPVKPRPAEGRALPRNPHMAAPGHAAMHADSYASDTYPFRGPLGRNPQVRTEVKSFGLPGLCSTVNYARSTGLIVAQCVQTPNFMLRLIDPVTLKDLATLALPPRPSTVEAVLGLDLDKVLTDTSGGAYYYLDAQDRAVLADSAFHVRRFAHRKTAQGWQFHVTDDWDLSPHVPHDCPTWTNPFPKGECDPVTSVQPDWNGLIWWVTKRGRVGTIDPKTGRIGQTKFAGENIQNSFAASQDGVSVVTDHALYLLRAVKGVPKTVWRRAYDRGTRRKVGQLDQGSGTTPTFVDRQYIGITDNADPRMNVLVYRAKDGKRLCKVPVFEPGKSASDNSLIGFGRSFVVENNSGYRNFFDLKAGASSDPGITRIDVTATGCKTVWTSKERSPSTVAKMSVAAGLVYAYTKEPRADGVDAWYFTAIDFHTGKTRFKVLTGTGKYFDNNWAPVTLGPDGTAYVGVVAGIVSIRDRP